MGARGPAPSRSKLYKITMFRTGDKRVQTVYRVDQMRAEMYIRDQRTKGFDLVFFGEYKLERTLNG